MKTVYIADDGTQFDDLVKCSEYERELTLESMYDDCLTPFAPKFIVENWDAIKAIMESTPTQQQNPTQRIMSLQDWSLVPIGTMIEVRDFEEHDWNEREYAGLSYDPSFPYLTIFNKMTKATPTKWQYARLIK